MNAEVIFTLIEKGLTLLPELVSAGISINQTVQHLITLNKAASSGGVISHDELVKIRSDFDTALDSFNTPI